MASAMGKGILTMARLVGPYVVVEGKDVTAFERLQDVESAIEAVDVAGYEFFDATGRRLAASVEGYRVRLYADPKAAPEPERLETALRDYFAGMAAKHERFAGYEKAADRARTLSDLLDLRIRLSNEPRFGRNA